jgi:hypothetical protein
MARIDNLLTGLMVVFLAACQGQAPVQPSFPTQADNLPVIPAITQTPEPITLVPQTLPTGNVPAPVLLPGLSSTTVQTPTFAATLVQQAPEFPEAPLPAGVRMAIFELGRPVVAEEFGFEEVRALLKDKSILDPGDAPRDDATWHAMINQGLSPFGYRVEADQESSLSRRSLSLYRGEDLLLGDITIRSWVSVNQSKTDFVMVVERISPHGVYLVRKDSLEQLAYGQEGRFGKYRPEAWPQFLGDDLIYAAIEHDPNRANPVNVVYRNEQAIYEIVAETASIRPPLYGLWTYDDSQGNHWCLEVLDRISIDGISMNERTGYQKSYEFHLIGGKPVFMFEKDGQGGLNYDGQEVMLPGESVLHYGCCSMALLNPEYTENTLAFFLQDGDRWKYVEMSVP